MIGVALGSLAKAAAPNLIVIMTDDMGYADVGFNGCKDIPTPHIDSIARAGVRFSNAYVTYSVCSPSRAGFLTGRYPQRFGHERNPLYHPDDPNMGLPLSEATLATVLKPAGYASGLVGKWHLGAHPTLHPLNRGFDFFFGHLGGGHRYLPEELTIKDSADATGEEQSYRTWIERNHEPIRTTKYLTDEFSDAAVDFVTANANRPFFLFLSYNAPHAPLQATKEYLDRFQGITDTKRRTYAAMVSAVDDGVGRVLGKLHELQIENNTLVVFLSDNGGPTQVNGSRNDPLRGKKGDVWEGGFRVPCAARWPDQFPKGVVYHQPVSSLDIFATMVAQARVSTDPARPLDGVDWLPYLKGTRNDAPHEAIYLRKFDQKRFAIRKGDYKLVILGSEKPPMLFNLAKDIAETTDLGSSAPEKLQALEELRVRWNSELIQPRFIGLESLPEFKNRKEPPD